MKKSMEERLADIQKRKQQLAEQEKLLKARMSQEDRKKRTRRLIQEGAIFEKYLDINSVEEATEICEFLLKQPEIMEKLYELRQVKNYNESEGKE